MKGTPILGIGSLNLDIIYIRDETDNKLLHVGTRGGGSIWNTLVNASLNGANTQAYCVGGSDAAARVCIDDLQKAGVQIQKESIQRGKRTRTLHEILSLKSINLGKPKHEFESRCPVCQVETYRKGTARVTKEFMKQTEKLLRGKEEDGVIIHLDGVDSTRLLPLRNINEPKILLSIDFGRWTGMYRMRQISFLDRLKGIDLLFVHSKVLPELVRITGSSSEKGLLKLLDAKAMISMKSHKGASMWINNGGEVSEFSQPPSNVNSIVDTAGAGDALTGFFLAEVASHQFNEINDLFENHDYLNDTLKKAQQWAGSKCKYVGARGHVAGSDGQTWSWNLTSKRIKTSGSIDDLRSINLTRTKCALCGSPILETFQTSISTLRFRQNVIQIPQKIQNAWSKRNDCPWQAVTNLKTPAYVIGTGGSFAVAYFTSLILTKKMRAPVIPIRPFDFIRLGIKVPTAIFISHSGKTHDVISAMEHANNLGIQRRVLITGVNQISDRIKLKPQDIVLSTGTNGERGFLSVAGTIVPCFMMWAALDSSIWQNDEGYLRFHKLYEKAKGKAYSAFSDLKRQMTKGLAGKRILILGGGFAWPAMLDIESKMVESGIAQPELSEIKDYSHGRFVSSLEDRRVLPIIFGMPDDEHFRDFMLSRLRSNNQVGLLTTDLSNGEGALDLMLQAELFMRFLSEGIGMDLSAPTIPQKGLQLYRYADILKFDNESK